MNEKEIKNIIAKSLGKKKISEAYVTQSKKYDLNTELLSQKSKAANQKLFEKYSDKLNKVSAELDVADRKDANPNHCYLRSLKLDETHNINGAYLYALHYDNISDVNSIIMLDSLAYLRIERDFGTFDDWQEDFIGCALSSRSGWAMLVYSIPLQRYVNVIADGNTEGIPAACIPVICLSVAESSYFRDYLSDRKAYIYAMMKELNWEVIEKRIKKAEKVGKLMSS